MTGLTGDDTISGAGGVTVQTQHTESQLSAESFNSAGYLVVTFTNDQVLTVKGATIDFHGGGYITA